MSRFSFCDVAALNLDRILWSPFAFQFRIHAPAAEAFIVHEFIVYNGAFCTIALFWLAFRWRQQTRRGLLIALFALAAVGFIWRWGATASSMPGWRSCPGCAISGRPPDTSCSFSSR